MSDDPDVERRAPEHLQPAAVCEGGNLDCGSGLLLLIKRSMAGVPAGQVLEIHSTEISVKEDLPAWCRLTSNPYLGWRTGDGHHCYFVRRGGDESDARLADDERQARDYVWRTRVRWSGGLVTKVTARNHGWEVGQPASFDVSDPAPSATEQLLGALGACLGMGFQVHASRAGIAVDALEVAVSGTLDNIYVFLGLESEGHPGFDRIEATLYVQASATPAELERIWQQTITRSPVAQTLARGVEVEGTLSVYQ